MSKYVPSTKGRIQFYVDANYLVVPGAKALGTQDRLIREPTMLAYVDFYNHWQRATHILLDSGGLTFTYLWVSDQGFRESCLQALKAYGVEEPETMKPVQLEELLFAGKLQDDPEEQLPYGLLFRVAHDVPKIRRDLGEPRNQIPVSPRLPWWKRFGIWLSGFLNSPI